MSTFDAALLVNDVGLAVAQVIHEIRNYEPRRILLYALELAFSEEGAHKDKWRDVSQLTIWLILGTEDDVSQWIDLCSEVIVISVVVIG